MKSVWTGIGAMIVISVIAWAVTGTQNESASERFVSENNSVRLDN
ncbi:MAG: hypothetical protein AAGF54_12940 [Pseudomonadota bacterium]